MLRSVGANALQTVLLIEMREEKDMLNDFAPQNKKGKKTCYKLLLVKRGEVRGKGDMLDGGKTLGIWLEDWHALCILTVLG